MREKRLQEFRKSLGLSQKSMGEKLGLSQQTYGTYENGRAEPSNDVLGTLSMMGLNIQWYLTGKGEMKSKDQAELINLSEAFQIPVMAQIGAGEVYEADIPQENDKFITLYRRPLKGEMAVVVKGDSMETTLYDGDVVTCVPIIPGSMQNGQDYVVVTESGPQIKQIFWEMGTKKLRLRSRNPKYKDDIFPEKVYRSFEIIDHVHKYRVPTERDPEKVEEEVEESKVLLKKKKRIYPGEKGHKAQ